MNESSTVWDLKRQISKQNKALSEVRQSIRLTKSKGKDEKNNTVIKRLNLEGNKIYVKDLGPQVKWDTVFFWEYAGPIVLYCILLILPHCFYSNVKTKQCQSDDELIFPLKHFPFYHLNKLCSGSDKPCFNIPCTT